MLRLILLNILLFIFLNQQEINAAQDLYGQSSGRIRTNINLHKTRNDVAIEHAKLQYKLIRSREMSSSFVQSRRFHSDQLARDYGHGSSFQSPISSSYHNTYGGGGGKNSIPSSQEGCRLTNNYCASDYQCCSGKCRCVRWSVMGKMSCLKKCF